ncbi:hypothetical protein L7F22_026075 [Adiantum nelumboides]|nr:hypothetical protein [Adiantum nelumboides]
MGLARWQREGCGELCGSNMVGRSGPEEEAGTEHGGVVDKAHRGGHGFLQPGEVAPDFLDNLEMAFLVSGRDDEATKLRAFPLTAFIEEFRHLEPPEEIWRQLLELRQTSPNDYRSYEVKFSNLWEKWCASLGEGERASECLKKDCFLAGLYPILREKVKVKFPDTFEKAMAYAREKDRKLKFQVQLQGGMEPPPPFQPIARTVAGTSATDEESSQQELLQQITNQLESLSINLVQGVRVPQSGNDRNRQEGQRQTREYDCYNCGEVGHGMYFCPHLRRYQGNGNHRRAPRQQVTPPRARPPNGQQNAPVAPPIQILRPPPPPPQTPTEIPPLPSGGEDRAVSVIRDLQLVAFALIWVESGFPPLEAIPYLSKVYCFFQMSSWPVRCYLALVVLDPFEVLLSQ